MLEFGQDVQVEIVKGITAVATAVTTGILAYLGSKKNSKKEDNEHEKLKLIFHPVFTRIDFYKNIVLNTFEFKNKGKEIVFKEILVQHLGIYKEILMDLCEAIDNKEEMDTNELRNRSINCISEINVKLNTFYVDNCKFTDDEKKVLDIVIGKYHNWDYGRESRMVDSVETICSSSFYPNTYAKAVTILDIFLFAIGDTIEDANKTLNNLNGDLKGLEFKGVVIK